MSVDRGYLGRAPGDRVDPHLHRSMDDLTFQKTKGLELVRLLRVSSALSPQQIFLYINLLSMKGGRTEWIYGRRCASGIESLWRR